MNFIKQYLFTIILSLTACTSSGIITYRQAIPADLPGLLALQAAQHGDDALRVLFFPEPYQSLFLTKALTQGRIFIAVDTATDAIVAQIKLFILDNQKEQTDVLSNELHCIGNDRELLTSGSFFIAKAIPTLLECHEPFVIDTSTLFLYLGSEFTHPAYRGQGINGALEGFAFMHLTPQIQEKTKLMEYKQLALCYGLVDENITRTPLILKQFMIFGNHLGIPPATPIDFFAYRAYKPTFELSTNGELKQLPGGHPGSGCILAYHLG